MAKKNKKDGEEKAGSKIATVIIALLIVIVWLGIFAALIRLDVGNFGSSVLRPVLKDVPVINKILPPASDEEVANESDYPYNTLAEAIERIKELEAENAAYSEQVETLNNTVNDQANEIARLKVFEDNQTSFQEAKDQFYNEIVYGDSAPSTDEYVEWYNELDAASAEEIYRQVIAENQASDDIKDLANSYALMDPARAADILEAMPNDLDTVALILSNMSADARGQILGNMDKDFAAKVTKKILP